MVLGRVLVPISCRVTSVNLQTSNFHNTAPQLLKQEWRKKKGLTMNPNAFGPLTNMADYSYKDGRPAPFGIKQLVRINKQRDYYEKIQLLTSEINYAVERHKRVQKEKADEIRRILDSKLKPKGVDF